MKQRLERSFKFPERQNGQKLMGSVWITGVQRSSRITSSVLIRHDGPFFFILLFYVCSVLNFCTQRSLFILPPLSSWPFPVIPQKYILRTSTVWRWSFFSLVWSTARNKTLCLFPICRLDVATEKIEHISRELELINAEHQLFLQMVLTYSGRESENEKQQVY